MATGIAHELRLRSVGRSDLSDWSAGWLFIAMLVPTMVVGASLMVRRPDHPVGWLFVALAASLSLAVPLDTYASEGLLVEPGSLPGATAVAVLGSLSFVPWLVLIASILHVTPTGRPLSRRYALALRVTVYAGAVMMVAGLLSDRTLDPPYAPAANPLAAGPLAGAFRVIAALAITVVGLGVLVAAFSLVVRFRRAQGIERLQLSWLAIVAVPVAALMVASFVPGHTSIEYDPLIPTSGIIVLLAAGTGLAVHRYRLYDVERLLSRTLTYALLSLFVAGVFVVVAVASGALFSRQGDASEVSVAVATLSAVGVAEPGRRRLQDRLDRRFDRRRYSAMSVLRRNLDAPEPVADIEAVLREALGDETLLVSYPAEVPAPTTGHWVTAAGLPAPATTTTSLDVLRGDRVVARIAYDCERVDDTIASAVFRRAATELDNAGLRALLAVQLVEVQQSRARLAAGQHEERRRIERNLHDGAQQRLLALALQLQAAAVNGSEARLRDAVVAGVAEARHAIAELRDLANGLRPAVLTDGGLQGALEELAERTGLAVSIDANLGGLAPDLEETAWFIVCEAVANAQKHGDAQAVDISAQMRGELLAIAVADDGRGGADPDGRGLRGLRDRAEAIGGSLDVHSPPSGGTVVEAVLPCVW